MHSAIYTMIRRGLGVNSGSRGRKSTTTLIDRRSGGYRAAQLTPSTIAPLHNLKANGPRDKGGTTCELPAQHTPSTKGQFMPLQQVGVFQRSFRAWQSSLPSRFISEIPEHLLNEIRSKPSVSQPVYKPQATTTASVNGVGVGIQVRT